MKVVIVAKTRMGSGACIGAVTFDGRSLRLIAPDAAANNHFNMEYNVGDVWEIEAEPDPNIIPPHTENVIVRGKRKLPPVDDITAFIEYQMPPKEGGLEALYEGMLREATSAGAMFIAERTGVPPCSTTFWRPDKPLTRDDDAKRIRYRYPTPDGGRTLTFVGFQEPLDEIPAGTLLRVSLAHWWRPSDMPEGELRCYVQLSGWYLPAEAEIEDFIEDIQSNNWQMGDWDTEESHSISNNKPPVASPQPTMPLDLSTAQSLLKRVFGYDEFRSLQADIIQNVLDKRDSLAVMPTGSGKSLCYQLPALMFPGLTVVVSPLISLMEDQVAQLREAGVTAVYLNSTLSYQEYLYTTNQIRSGAVKLLYVAPETLLRPETLNLLQQIRVDCLTIDEAHCISEWGHDFRPEYRQLADVRRRLPDAVSLSVTATATGRVRQDIKSSLGISDAGEFVASFDRENLFLAVEPKSGGVNQLLAFLEAHKEQAGIIYCATRKQVDNLTQQLANLGWPVLPYHAGLDAQTRRQNQRRFSYEEDIVMVATIAFGMGINKSNVRYIMHYDLPKNLESYYQQIGRAGRDGLRADCLLLFSYGDVQNINYFIMQAAPSQQAGARARLEAMIRFAETNVCRRRPLLDYFGEEYRQDNCDMCDNCQAEEAELADLTIPAQKFLSCVKRTGEFFGASHIIDVLRGSRSQKVLKRRHDRLSTYNIGGEFSKKEWQYLARQFIQQGLLAQDMQYGSLKLTPKAYAVFKGEKVMGVLPQRETAVTYREAETAHDPALFALLRQKRTELASAANVPPYVIFSDRSLVEMAAYYPHSRQSFAQLYGVGQAKLEKYADEFLPIIRDYCREHDLEEKKRATAVASTPSQRIARSAGGNRTVEVGEAFNAGQSVPEIAEAYGVKERTVLNHLWKYVQGGRPLRSDGLLELSQLPPETQQ
ncbi:MAG TPA: DNA helicase RecQ, partial [Anaerolineae bacterium]|nr:DNA helicase RecQ [Anaerolineae bacterium]